MKLNKIITIAVLTTAILVAVSGVFCCLGGLIFDDTAEIKTIETKSKLNDTMTSEPVATKTPEATKKPEIMKVRAGKLIEDYNANEVKANKLYKNKTAEVTGTIYSISEILGMTTVRLRDNDFSITSVTLYFSSKSEIEKIVDLKKGNDVTVIGKIEGMGFDINIKNCKFK